MDKIVQKKSRHNKLSLNLKKRKRFKNILRFTTARCFSQLRKEVATRSRSTRMLYQQCWTKMFLIFRRAKPILPNFQTHTKRWSCSPEKRAGDTVDFYYLENWEGLASFKRITPQVWICARSITLVFILHGIFSKISGKKDISQNQSMISSRRKSNRRQKKSNTSLLKLKDTQAETEHYYSSHEVWKPPQV